METNRADWHSAYAPEMERPSEEFIRAVAELLETDAEDILSELGYVYDAAIVRTVEAVAA